MQGPPRGSPPAPDTMPGTSRPENCREAGASAPRARPWGGCWRARGIRGARGRHLSSCGSAPPPDPALSGPIVEEHEPEPSKGPVAGARWVSKREAGPRVGPGGSSVAGRGRQTCLRGEAFPQVRPSRRWMARSPSRAVGAQSAGPGTPLR